MLFTSYVSLIQGNSAKTWLTNNAWFRGIITTAIFLLYMYIHTHIKKISDPMVGLGSESIIYSL